MPTSLVVNAGSTSHKLALLELTGGKRLPYLWQARIDWGGAQAGGLLRWRWGETPGSTRPSVLTMGGGTPWPVGWPECCRPWWNASPSLSWGIALSTAVNGFSRASGLAKANWRLYKPSSPWPLSTTSLPWTPLSSCSVSARIFPRQGVFDTAFHHTIPEAATTYGLPMAWRQQGIRRCGFHGISHNHMARSQAAPSCCTSCATAGIWTVWRRCCSTRAAWRA